MDIKEIIKYWVSLAEYDLEAAKSMYNAGIYLNLGHTCFQLIEKLLTGYYWKIKKDEPPFDYNLSILMSELSLRDKLTEKQRNFLDTLEPFSRRSRNPEVQPSSLTKEKSLEIIAGTEDLYKKILQLINQD